tara:strand:- start:23 stop:526 length:504 start_codon:yes stop_codon:yes gene_type:complete
MSWNEENTKKLQELWKKGLTASQIAAQIPGKSRNAIIGRAHRLKLESRAISKRTTVKAKTENQNVPEIKTQKLGRKARFKALLLDRNFEPENPIYNLENLNDQTCRYPIGHPSNDSSFHFCGRKPYEKSVYCRLHLILCFQPKNAKEEDKIESDDIPQFIEKKIKSA